MIASTHAEGDGPRRAYAGAGVALPPFHRAVTLGQAANRSKTIANPNATCFALSLYPFRSVNHAKAHGMKKIAAPRRSPTRRL